MPKFSRASLRVVLLAASALAAPTFALAEEQPTVVDSVIVTAARNPEDPPVVANARARLSETPGAVAVISAESYANRYAPGVADLLRDVPGVYAQKKWGGDTRLSIRGSGIGNSTHNRGTLLAQDGVPFNEADGFGDFQLIDPSIARYTEVYKGGNALRFGGALLGGAINLVTPTGRDAGGDNLLRIEGGSYGTLRGHAEAARVWGDWDAFAAVTAQQAEGWRTQSAGQEQHASLNIGRRFGEEQEVRLLIHGGYVHQEIPGAVTLAQVMSDPEAANPGNRALNYQRDMGSMRAALQTHWRLSPSTVFEGGVYATWKDLDHPIFQVIDQESRNWGAFGRFDWEGELAGRRADAFYGASFRSGDLDANQWVNVRGSRGAQTAKSRQNARALDVFAEGRVFVTDQVALVAGGSYGRAERDYQGFKLPGVASTFNLAAGKDDDWFAPRVGVIWQDAGGAQVYANLTRSVEPPNFSALAPTVGGFTPLRPQEAWTGELGTRGRRGALIWDVTLYRAQLEHELLNYTVNPAQGIPASTFNADKTIHQGLEAGLDWTLAQGLRLRQTYAWSDFRFEGDVQYGDHRLPVVPEHLYRAELRYEHPFGWFVAPSVEWSIKDTVVDYQNSLRSSSYAVANLGAGWKLGNGLSLFLDARNLFDTRYVSNVSAITDARLVSQAVFFPGEGRSVFGGLTWRY
ncbi:TonB-dependent receptor [Phenylobacterium sp.]|uniref:TonB-dependent receptor family protein n=1 Tax=Phenylobacterium sp. TaxID=1871053 RepID=UPI00271A6F04|nr:TonB-dependent receptor [Phenylobacterium sp.]MDO8377726.1 TonB-dependent receptor [Phenylobacterium sp.]